MPKVVTPQTPNSRSHVTPNPATKTAQRRANRDNIQQLLYDIRRTAGLATSFRRPTKSNLRPIDVKLGIAPGSFILLGAYLEKQLVGLKSVRSIDRYIAVTGVWREIKWNTPFVVRDGSNYCF
ncbi:hypothetical protein BT96DRAFT_1006318 [Gymnopus androsaceus JB14]|uniref:Uncharacterized protein n=1 Tax=Gymnopus androsaceus JB14 TaxID=1447944 RepID=A0A6A4GLT1_9AGAR|nr:hypothetical protein BT96DRAFT_1006318 [Gymnopus androsaceus JB14]